MKAINLQHKLSEINKKWHPHQITIVDDMQILLAKIQGEFVWHAHKDEDELFQVIKGTLEIHFRRKQDDLDNGPVEEWVETIHEGELIVVPKGVEHCPKTLQNEEVHVLLFEKLSTAHTGTTIHENTITNFPKI